MDDLGQSGCLAAARSYASPRRRAQTPGGASCWANSRRAAARTTPGAGRSLRRQRDRPRRGRREGESDRAERGSGTLEIGRKEASGLAAAGACFPLKGHARLGAESERQGRRDPGDRSPSQATTCPDTQSNGGPGWGLAAWTVPLGTALGDLAPRCPRLQLALPGADVPSAATSTRIAVRIFVLP
jgi:hypothetical protein